MAKTIIQTIGPLYGEVVNGTVFGRPNGSIYVPPSNVIKLDFGAEYVTNSPAYPTWVFGSTNAGAILSKVTHLVAESQDNAAYMAIQFSDDADFATYSENILPAGQFNLVRDVIVSGVTIVNEETYYIRAVLYASMGVPVAFSNVVTVTGVTA